MKKRIHLLGLLIFCGFYLATNANSFSAILETENELLQRYEEPTNLDCPHVQHNFPFEQDFEANIFSPTPLSLWTNPNPGSFSWVAGNGSTTSANTGPSGAAEGSGYIYTEASGFGAGDEAIIYTCFDFANINDPAISFKYHMYGRQGMELKVETYRDNSGWEEVWSSSEYLSTNWHSATIELPGYGGHVVGIRFVGVRGPSYRSDMAIDKLVVGEYLPCESTVTNFPYSEGFNSNWGSWTNYIGDDFHWLRRSGSTPSRDTGPTGAIEGSHYAYVEASYGNHPNKKAGLYSCFLFSGLNNPQIKFNYNMYGDAIGNLKLGLSVDGINWNTEWGIFGNEGPIWKEATVNLQRYANEHTVYIRFLGETGRSWAGDIAIDNIRIYNTGATPNCTPLDFEDYTISGFGGSQDQGDYETFHPNGLYIHDNAWKMIPFSYTVTANTMVKLKFDITRWGEVHGFGFETDDGLSPNTFFQFGGTQNWGIQDYHNYPTNSSPVRTYTIPVGQYFSGNFVRLVFACDDDADTAGNGSNAKFWDFQVYEQGQCNPQLMADNEEFEGRNPSEELESTEEAFDKLYLYPNPAYNQLYIEFPSSKAQSYILSIANIYGRILQVENVTAERGFNQWELGLNELSGGAYILIMKNESGAIIQSKRFNVVH